MARGFKRPFRAVPIRLGTHYRRKERAAFQASAIRYLCLAGLAGLVIGIGSAAFDDTSSEWIAAVAKRVAVEAGLVRAR